MGDQGRQISVSLSQPGLHSKFQDSQVYTIEKKKKKKKDLLSRYSKLCPIGIIFGRHQQSHVFMSGNKKDSDQYQVKGDMGEFWLKIYGEEKEKDIQSDYVRMVPFLKSLEIQRTGKPCQCPFGFVGFCCGEDFLF